MKQKILIFLTLLVMLCGCQVPQSTTVKKIEITEIGTMIVGDSKTLEVKLTNLTAVVNYESSNSDILIVDQNGVVTAVSEGTANVIATLTESEIQYTDSIQVEVLTNEGETPIHEHITCSVCGKCLDEECPEEEFKCLGHEVVQPDHECSEFMSEWLNPENFECGEGITQKIVCTKCNKVLDERTVDLDHTYESEVITAKTCEQDGEIKFTCTTCGYNFKQKDYTLGHQKDEIKVIIPATTNTLGTKQIKCKNCEYIYNEFNYVDNAYHHNGKLSVKGPDLVNQYGEKYQLYGLSTHGIQWFSKVVNFDTISEIQENFGNNIIRFAMYTDENGYCDGSETTKKMMLDTLHRGIEIATDLGLYVIVDWHMVGAENVLDKNPLTYLEEAKVFFSYISEYYKDQDNILYEIMNEPNGSTTWADCKKYANEIIPLIRKNTDAIILVGNPKWTADLNSVMNDPLVGYDNIMYTYHFYAADHSSTTQVVKAYDSGFPVFISEFGFMESSGDGNISETNGDKWKKVLDTRNISYVAWNISNSKGSASIFKYNTSNLKDVSDSNLKVWGVYLKNWYRAKSLNQQESTPDEDLTATVQLNMEIPEWSSSYECFIISSGHSDSRLDYNWSSTNEAVLTVSEYSTITIIGDGSCSIICKNKSTGAVGILDVVVENGTIKTWTSRYTE